jgi:hypothetical protein
VPDRPRGTAAKRCRACAVRARRAQDAFGPCPQDGSCLARAALRARFTRRHACPRASPARGQAHTACAREAHRPRITWPPTTTRSSRRVPTRSTWLSAIRSIHSLQPVVRASSSAQPLIPRTCQLHPRAPTCRPHHLRTRLSAPAAHFSGRHARVGLVGARRQDRPHKRLRSPRPTNSVNVAPMSSAQSGRTARRGGRHVRLDLAPHVLQQRTLCWRWVQGAATIS